MYTQDVNEIFKRTTQRNHNITQEEIDEQIEEIFVEYDKINNFKGSCIDIEKVKNYNRVGEIVKEIEKTTHEIINVVSVKPSFNDPYCTIAVDFSMVIDFKLSNRQLFIEALSLADSFTISAVRSGEGRMCFGFHCTTK